MHINVSKVPLQEVAAFRALFLHENRFQFVYNKCHQHGWADTWLFELDGRRIGYGSLWGKNRREDRDEIFECYLLPEYRAHTDAVFAAFAAACGAGSVIAQSNDQQLILLLFQHCREVQAEAILFKDATATNIIIPGAIFREWKPGDLSGEEGEYVLELNNSIVASGGYVWNYNLPYIDMYYAVPEQHRRRGFGSYFTQELKRKAYSMQRVPAARCNIHNGASKATLIRAGMVPCGCLVTGKLLSAPEQNS